MAEKDFDAEFDYGEREGHTFVLGGEKFHTVGIAPLAAFLSDSRGLDAALEFIRKVLIKEDRQAFDLLIHSENPPVPISAFQVDSIAQWLITVTSGRPTQAPSSSGTGRAKTSAKSKGNSS